ncbi:acr-11 [Pristionchus pacificus]|nr:acr-11 [Pristionchus pacificus]
MLAFLVLSILATVVKGSSHETKLFNDLLNGYNPMERPVENATEALVVNIKFYLQQILDVDEKNQLVSINAWLSYGWRDYKLGWNPDDYGGIQDIRFPGTSDHIWKPDILLYNSAAEDFDSTYKSNLLVYSTGDVTWIPPGVLKFVCSTIDVTWFPFDDQVCQLKFGSWTFHGFAIDLQIDAEMVGGVKPTYVDNAMDLSTYVENGEWLLMSSPARRDVTYYTCCPEPYPTVLYYLHIRRRTLFYGFNLIIPSLLISLMTVLGFTLPPDAGEKITLEVTILLAIVFFLSMVSEMTPPTGEAVPLIGVFFSCCMLVVSASVVFTVVILNLHFRTPDTHEMSPLLSKVLLEFLPWILMMSRPGHRFYNGGCYKEHKSSYRLKRLALREELPTQTSVNEAHILMLHAINDQLEELAKRAQREEQDARTQADWRFAALAVDRACLILFTLFIVTSSVAIMCSAPHLYA